MKYGGEAARFAPVSALSLVDQTQDIDELALERISAAIGAIPLLPATRRNLNRVASRKTFELIERKLRATLILGATRRSRMAPIYRQQRAERNGHRNANRWA
jgi:hypothetical protein